MQFGVGGESKFIDRNLEKLMYADKQMAGNGLCATQAATPPKPVRNLIESRNSLADGLEHLVTTISLLDSLLDTLRPSPQPNGVEDKEVMPCGQIMTSLDSTADLYSRHLNRLRRRVEELDGILGSGFCSPAATPARG